MGIQSPVVERIDKKVTLGVVFAINLDFHLNGNEHKQEYVAEVSGQSQQYISKLMDPTKRINPTLRVVEGISKALEIPAGDLLSKREGVNYKAELGKRLAKKAKAKSAASAG